MAQQYDARLKNSYLNSSGTGEDDKIQAHREAEKKLHGQHLMDRMRKETIYYSVERADHPDIKAHASEKKVEDEEEDDNSDSDFDSEDMALLNDPNLDIVHQNAYREMAADMKREREMERRREQFKLEGMEERQALECGVNNEYVVLTFEHPKMIKTTHLSWHLNEMAPRYPDTKFIAVDATKCSFLVEKFKIKTLPSVIIMIRGKLQDKIIGFEEFGGNEAVTTNGVIRRLREAGVVPDNRGKYLKKAPRTQTMLDANHQII